MHGAKTCLLVLSGAMAAAVQVPAAEEGDAAAADVVVTALRYERDPFEIPYVARRLDADAVQLRQAARSTPEALKEIPSAMIQKTANGQGSPYLRGFTGFRTLMLVDGIRLNNSTFREGPNQYWSTVDPLSVRAFDVVMGPASTLYGSDAIGGTVNALPVEPQAWVGEPAWEKRLYARGATAEDALIGRAQLRARPSEQVGLVLGGSLKSFGDLEGGKDVGTQEHTGYDESAYDARLDFHPRAHTRVTLAHQAVDQDDVWRTHRTIYGIDWEGLKRGDDRVHTFDQHRDLTYARLRAEQLGAGWDGLTATLSRHVQSEDQVRVKKDDAQERQGFDVTTWGAQLQSESSGRSGRWVYGAEIYRDEVDSYLRKYEADGSLKSEEIQGPVADDARYDTLGVYVQDTLPMGAEGLEITPGARYTRSAADADGVKDPLTGNRTGVEGDWDALVGSLRLLAPMDDHKASALFGGVSQGFRAPNLSDLTRFDIARAGEVETPVDDLDPERFLSLEAGARCQGPRHAAQVVYYHTLIEDLIVRAPTGREIDGMMEVTKRNASEGYVHGVELSGSWEMIEAWTLRGRATWMEGEADSFPTSDPASVQAPMSRIMPLSGELALGWQRPDGRCRAELIATAADKADELSPEDERDTQRIPPGGTPGYAILSVRGGVKVTRQLELSVAVENLFDEDYRIHGSGVNEPGRNLVVAADYTF